LLTVERLGLFGGSFDPVHLAHLLVAQAALEELELSRLYFIPAAQSPFKPETQPAPALHRLAMLRLALAGRCAFEVDDSETTRGGVSFTIDTVRAYAARHPRASLYYLIGADHLPALPQWREAPTLADMVEFVVIPRPAESLQLPPPPFRVRALRGVPLALSSSLVRARIRGRRSIADLVPPSVAEYIQHNQLYF
jgi:nicotinate-nucleotide adenylyltransferase